MAYLAGGEKFFKLDLCQACQQDSLEQNSHKYETIKTLKVYINIPSYLLRE